MGDYRTTRPEEIWKKIRDGEITEPTAGMCGGYAQANLVILPKKYAEDFKKFAERNPKPCPILEIMDGSPLVHDMGEGANIVTDIPRYFIYKNGVKVDEVTDASEYWQDDFVGFLIGCSFSFEEALLQAGIDVRHISMGRNVPMYKTNIECEKAGVFEGCMQHAPDDARGREKGGGDHGEVPECSRWSCPHGRSGKDRHQGYRPSGLWRSSGDPRGRDPGILGLRRDPTGSRRAGEAADRHHPRSGSYVYHECEERGVE